MGGGVLTEVDFVDGLDQHLAVAYQQRSERSATGFDIASGQGDRMLQVVLIVVHRDAPGSG